MTEDRKLLVGVDLCNDHSQISCYRRDVDKIISVGHLLGREREYECPTVLSYHPVKKEWLFGTEALMASEREEVYLFRDILKQIDEKNCVEAGDMKLDPVMVLMRYFVKLLSCLKEYFPSETIRRLVVSVSQKTDNIVNAIKGALCEMGIGEERFVIQLHQQSYMYYALSQKKELWMNDVGLFEFGREGLFYSQIHIDRRNIPYIVDVKRVDLSQSLNWDMMEHDSSFKMEYAFVNLANTQMHKQLVTTIYVTGEGFQGEWANAALSQLCSGRRVFRGNNLFTKGACAAAREFAGEGILKDFLFLDQEMIYTSISLKVYRDARQQELELVKAGTPWREVDVRVDFIPDDESELQLTVQNVLRRETTVHLLSLEGFENRMNKMTRFTLRLRFADTSHCIVTLKDDGFGEYYSSSNRIWERYLSL
ncbi:MAG: DUF5716 family protein [Lachnospiraceae bacterium]|nr:DUF5716 family protein [Lachnospiraceae bacterium]